MSAPQTPGNAKAPEKLDVRDVIDLTERLSRVLASEVDALRAMKMSRVQALQEEKQMLTAALEAHRRLLARHPHLKETIPSRDRKDLEATVRVFEDILKENHARLLVAREINRQIVQAVAKAVQEKAVGKVYDGRGDVNGKPHDGMSFSLNQTA